jgi:hypothetical protein
MVPSPRGRAQPRTLALTTNRPLAALPTRRATRANALAPMFAAATLRAFPRDGVLLWIREDRPGPATIRWPRLPRRTWPQANDFTPVSDGIATRWPRLRWERAAAQRNQTRFSLWLVSGPEARPADRARALTSAASFAFSVGSFRNRPCRRTCETGRPLRVVPVRAAG